MRRQKDLRTEMESQLHTQSGRKLVQMLQNGQGTDFSEILDQL